jgi:transcriptional regulator with XRE-family HTH domain
MRRACLHTDVPKRLTDEQRGPLATWIVRQREARGWKQDSMAGRLAEKGYRVRDDYYRQVESGKKPGPDFLAALEALFETGYVAPVEPEPEPQPHTAPEMFDLLAAMAQQTTVVTELVKELRAERQERTSMADTVSELRAEIRALAAGLAEALKGSGGGAGPAQEPSQGGQGGPPPAGKKTPSHSPVTDR